MHAAYTLASLRGLQHAPSSLLAHAGKLYVGTASGTLAVYRLPPAAAPRAEDEEEDVASPGDVVGGAAAALGEEADATLQLLETHVLGKRPLEALGVIKECALLLVLTDSNVNPYDLHTLTPAAALSSCKGAQAMCVDTSIQRLPSLSRLPPGSQFASLGANATLGRAFRADASGTPSGTLRGASLRGMADLVRAKEDGKRERERQNEGGENSLVSTLAVGMRRKVVVLRWVDGAFFDVTELPLPHTPRCLCFPAPLSLFMGYTSTTYAIQALPLAAPHATWEAPRDVGGAPEPQPQSLAGWGAGALGALTRARAPVVRAATEGETLVLRDQMTVFLGADGSPARREAIDWGTIPDDVAFARPYVLALLPPALGAPASLAVRSAQTLSPVQTLPLANTPAAAGLGGSPLLISAGPRAAIVGTAEGLWAVRMRPWARQVDELVKAQAYGEALATLEGVDEVLLPDKPARKAYVEALWALDLYRSHKYDEALEHFLELDINPARVIALYPARISGALARSPDTWGQLFGAPANAVAKQATKEDDLPAPVPRDRTRLTSLWRRPQSMYAAAGASETPTPPILSPAKSSRNLTAVQDDDTRSLRSVNSSRSVLRVPSPKPPAATTATTPATAAALTAPAAADLGDAETQRRALDALGRFLADRRRIFKPLLEVHAESHTDASQQKRDPDALLALPNAPLASLGLDELTGVAQAVDTALFKTFLETKPALLGPLCRVENWCEVEQVEELLLERRKFSELIALYGGKNMHDKALKLLRKFSEEEDDEEEKVGPTIRYLQNLGPEYIDLVLETSHWVLEANAKLGMDIFCADTGKVSSLPRFPIVMDLEAFNPDLCIAYLEHLVALGEGDPSLHEKLALLLLKRASSAQRAGDVTARAAAVEQLIRFLEGSTQYRSEKILSRLPAGDEDVDLLEARALLLGRLGQHEGALKIYVAKLKDEAKAEEYCRRVWADGATERKADADVFLTLLRLYLRPATSSAPSASAGDAEKAQEELQLQPALRLITRHGARIDAVAALELLPPLVHLRDVRAFAQKTLQQGVARRNEARVVREVLAARTLQLDERVARLHSRRVKITETRTCPRCMKRLGNSVIAVTTTGAVLHYSCR